MTVVKLRSKLVSEIGNINDEKKLRQLYDLVRKKTFHNPIVGYKASGEPITELDIENRIKSSKKRISQGEFKTNAQMKSEIEKWIRNSHTK